MKQERNEESFKILNTRMDTFNGVGTAQEKQQKLNTQVRAFACKITFPHIRSREALLLYYTLS